MISISKKVGILKNRFYFLIFLDFTFNSPMKIRIKI